MVYWFECKDVSQWFPNNQSPLVSRFTVIMLVLIKPSTHNCKGVRQNLQVWCKVFRKRTSFFFCKTEEPGTMRGLFSSVFRNVVWSGGCLSEVLCHYGKPSRPWLCPLKSADSSPPRRLGQNIVIRLNLTLTALLYKLFVIVFTFSSPPTNVSNLKMVTKLQSLKEFLSQQRNNSN